MLPEAVGEQRAIAANLSLWWN